jgi:hypothetical protein
MSAIGEMTQEEFREMVEAVVEHKLIELFGDPDEGLELTPALRQRLERQQQAVADGERGRPLDALERDLGIE